MDCSTHPEITEEGYSTFRKCDRCEFSEMWANLLEHMGKLESDEIITNYNEVKKEALSSLVLFEEKITGRDGGEGRKNWAKSTNVSNLP